ncbi:MAG: DNA (cytosine-5-)-methyltransferase [Sulfuricaulis sp.]
MDSARSTQDLLAKACWIYTQQGVADHLGVSREEVNRWLKSKPSVPKMVRPHLERLFPSRPKHYGEADFTFIDLFAGIGGIRRAFESAGGECVFTSEWNEYAQKTYAANFYLEGDIHGDINRITHPAKQIPDHDVLLAGFPCQPFSIAGVSKKNSLGHAHGFECKTQGTLFFKVAQIIKAKRPIAFMLENVKNLRSHDKGNTYRVIRETLDELGYYVDDHVIDARYFVPQHRERIIIVGFRRDMGFSLRREIDLPKEGPRLRAVLEPEKQIDPKYILTPKLWRYLQDYAAKHKAKGNGFGFGRVGPNDVARTLSARYYKDGSEILINRGPRKRPRRLTPRECARLMGFDGQGEEDFRIPVSDTQAYKQFGNSVVVPVITEVARAMKPHILALKQEMQGGQPQLRLVG